MIAFNTEQLVHLESRGRDLLECTEPNLAQAEFVNWIQDVENWLDTQFPGSSLSLDWAAVTIPNVLGGGSSDTAAAWATYHRWVERRLTWLSSLPRLLRLKRLAVPQTIQQNALLVGRREIRVRAVSRAYVDPGRIEDLKERNAEVFDTARLVRICEELNVCYAGECYLATVMMVRAIMDHVPPVFEMRSFAEVANNYTCPRSFKEAMQQLDKTSRKIADMYLHTQIRSSETVPNAVQVDFSASLDLLLGEVLRILK